MIVQKSEMNNIHNLALRPWKTNVWNTIYSSELPVLKSNWSIIWIKGFCWTHCQAHAHTHTHPHQQRADKQADRRENGRAHRWADRWMHRRASRREDKPNDGRTSRWKSVVSIHLPSCSEAELRQRMWACTCKHWHKTNGRPLTPTPGSSRSCTATNK